MQGFEMIKDLKVDATPFSVENDLLTPTFKQVPALLGVSD